MIVITEFMDEAAVREGLACRDVIYDPSLVDRPEALAPLLAKAHALIVRNRTQVRPALLDLAPNLRVVGRLGVGLDNIDMEACKTRGIAVCPALGANDDSVAEYVIGTAMLLLRGAYQSNAAMVGGEWPRNRLTGREISGKVLGLIGFGGIARATAQRAVALGMSVVAYDPFLSADSPVWSQPWGKATPSSLDDLLAKSDLVSLHVPLTDDTRRMIDTDAIAKMRDDAILINAARGGVVDEAAVIAALKAGTLGGAALDVFEAEPLKATAGADFADVPNLVLTPHIAGVTVESNDRVSWLTVKNVLQHLEPAQA
ncbi:hydroxyacid dehydrogenase [Paracoccus laeviglucosivorans]|uniref:(S)-sulfolactate dehydrogenase n=1 Tax=Paracoccus laeviglucosivorans TaxID=1197861 RepID=A0A521FN47_9RHOB|nr:hydroxyacid dehydrogenase [Paracoccus laeviglucosivorans]SMO97546.1 (S)-sulfolactate dehydrogenase [Paracoccus laeviglucosivorans]